jgi:hypothetical protein
MVSFLIKFLNLVAVLHERTDNKIMQLITIQKNQYTLKAGQVFMIL